MSQVIQKLLRNLPRAASRPIWAFERSKELLTIGLNAKHKDVYRLARWNNGNLKPEHVGDVFPELKTVDVTLIRTFDRVVGSSVDVFELAVLCAFVKQRNAKNILEIGTFHGNTTLNLAANSPADARITTVDLPIQWSGQMALENPLDTYNPCDREKVGWQIKEIKESPYAGKVRQVFADSASLDWGTLDGPFDLVFIDGCHAYDYVRRDTANALAHTKPDGIILWHDYGNKADVARAVDEYSAGLDIHVLQGTRLAVAKLGTRRNGKTPH
jgi:predicted O-methyltransferase YrrM